MDFITELPDSNGYDSILVIVDKLTKYATFIPTHSTVNEEGTAELFFQHIISQYGIPRQVITDRDSRWTGSFWKDIGKRMNTQRALTTAYHPQADGQTEVMNQILETALRSYSNLAWDNWSHFFHAFALSYGSTPHPSTSSSPSFLIYGFHPLLSSNFLHPSMEGISQPNLCPLVFSKCNDLDQCSQPCSLNIVESNSNRHDFHYVDNASLYMVLHLILAGTLWELLKMKGCYISATINRWTKDTTFSLLPAMIPIGRLKEIDMVHHPFPPIPQLTFNFVEMLEIQEVVMQHNEDWQENSHQFTVWISQARLNPLDDTGYSWLSPAPPHPSSTINPSSPFDNYWVSISSSLGTTFTKASLPLQHVTCAFHFHIGSDVKRQVRILSLIATFSNGTSANKKQLILWKSGLAQLLELQQSLIHSGIESENGLCTAKNLQSHMLSATLHSHSHAVDPHISAPPPSIELPSANTNNHASSIHNLLDCLTLVIAHTSTVRYRNL